jgi:hypothetical protein
LVSDLADAGKWFTKKKMTTEEMQTLPDYPDETEGSILAARARKDANSFSDEQRDEYFRAAMLASMAQKVLERR